MTDLTALIRKLEQATGPDRELDAEITRALGFKVGRDPERPGDPRYYFEPTPGHSWEECWRYTTSLDAALTLVPAGHTIYMTLHAKPPCRFWACTPPPGMGGPQSAKKRRHLEGCSNANEAIALCIAALKARTALAAKEE